MYHRGILFALLSLCLVVSAQLPTRYGVLYVNEIVANSDTHTVRIEDSVVEDNYIRLDVIEEFNGNGITPEGIYIKDSDVNLFGDFVVHPATYFQPSWNFTFNGGLVADSPLQDFFSFAIEDNTGKTSIRGLLTAYGGINSDTGAFVINGRSGETIIRDALLHPNGGINLGEGKFVVSTEGELTTKDNIHVLGNLFVGSTETNERYVGHIPSPYKIGKDTFISAQSGSLDAGDLYLVPGIGGQRVGSIFIGRESGDDILFGRQLWLNATDASDTYIRSQTSTSGDGGDLILKGGDSSTNGSGGDVILAPGVSRKNGVQGRILLGSDIQEEADFDLVLSRPPLFNGNGGDTFLRGQSAQNGQGGNLYIQAGQVPTNAVASSGGSLFLSPGIASDPNFPVFAPIILGSGKGDDLDVTRYTLPSIGGATAIRGQPSVDGEGGDLFIRAGSNRGGGRAGNLYLYPGTTTNLNTPVPGQIFVGLETDYILITLPPPLSTFNDITTGLDTTISGQDSPGADGGAFILSAGDGNAGGGDLFLNAGSSIAVDDQPFNNGGQFSLLAGDGYVGGSVFLFSGSGGVTTSGDVVISSGTGSSPTETSGNIVFSPGSGQVPGFVTIGPTVDITLIATDVLILNQELVLTTVDPISGFQTGLFLSAEPTSVVSYTPIVGTIAPSNLLRSESTFDVKIVDLATPFTVANHYERLSDLQATLNAVINSLGQCQHGLLQTTIVDPRGNFVSRDCTF